MRVGSTLKPGQPGTKKLLQRYGDRLIAVRYRYDEKALRRMTTVELIEDEIPWQPQHRQPDAVAVRVDWKEETLRDQLTRSNDARWDAKRKLWITTANTARRLGVYDRAVPTQLSHLK